MAEMESDVAAMLLEGIPMPLVLISAEERVEVANAAARALLGEGIVARHYLMAMRQPDLLEAIDAARTQGLAGQARHVRTGAGSPSTYRVTVSPAGDGLRRRVLCAFEDISEVEQIGQMRRDFVANVSHELRTPLTALLGFIETLRGNARDDPAARERFLGIMEREALRMNRLVRDLLSLGRVEAEERVRPTERVDIASIAGSVVAILRPMAAAQQVAIQLEGAEKPAIVAADPDQMTQVLHNLIENAVKYGGAGKTVTVVLDLAPWDERLRGPALSVRVTDQGDGIDPVHLPRLTERFYRVDSHRSRAQGGTGLGLAIVKHIVNRHRGQFRIESEIGKGSTFTVLLPAG